MVAVSGVTYAAVERHSGNRLRGMVQLRSPCLFSRDVLQGEPLITTQFVPTWATYRGHQGTGSIPVGATSGGKANPGGDATSILHPPS